MFASQTVLGDGFQNMQVVYDLDWYWVSSNIRISKLHAGSGNIYGI